jgi:ATP-dependent Lhr-like helicase
MLPALLSIADLQCSGLHTIWITPIKALAREIEKAALKAIESSGIKCTVGIRTGDTDAQVKQGQFKSFPNILITTPESLHLLLARKGFSKLAADLRFFVVDEWHELIGTKRGVMVELAVSRLKSLAPSLCVWGISATMANLQEAARVLVGNQLADSARLIRSKSQKHIEIISILPTHDDRMPWSGHLGVRMADELLAVLNLPGSCLVFTNTRAQCEAWYRRIIERDLNLAGLIAMHHGSVARETRQWVEEAIYDGKLRAVVCTSSLDLGVDFAPVDRIVQIGGPKGVARFVQRAGRSGHRPDAPSCVYFLPTNALELIEASALRLAIKKQFVESRDPLIRCFDVLVQYLVTLAVGDGFNENEAFQQVKSTYCFASITEQEWNWIMAFITRGGTALAAYPEFHKVVNTGDLMKVTSIRVARKHRLSIGTIVSDTMMAIKQKKGGLVGHVEEWFIASLNEGDHFWFAGQPWQLLRVKELTAYVVTGDAKKGKIPSWQGGKLPLSSRMSELLRSKVDDIASGIGSSEPEMQRVQSIMQLQKERSHIPRKTEFLIEMVATEEGSHLMFYPFEGRFVHEGLASLVAYRIGRAMPISFSLAYNDYGFELVSESRVTLDEAWCRQLFSPESLTDDLLSSINAVELSRRRFREIASIAGLVFKGYPGQPIRDKHLQSSSSLIYQVMQDYDPNNLLFRQSIDEVIYHQLEFNRLAQSLKRIALQKIVITTPDKPTPLAFPIMVDRLREKMSSESLESRIQRMVLDWSH